MSKNLNIEKKPHLKEFYCEMEEKLEVLIFANSLANNFVEISKLK